MQVKSFQENTDTDDKKNTEVSVFQYDFEIGISLPVFESQNKKYQYQCTDTWQVLILILSKYTGQVSFKYCNLSFCHLV